MNLNEYVDLYRYSANSTVSSEVPAAEEMTFESFCECFARCRWSPQFNWEVLCHRVLHSEISPNDHSPCRAPIVATWADRFSWCCWRRFSRFLTCPLTLHPQCLSVIVYHLCSTLLLLP